MQLITKGFDPKLDLFLSLSIDSAKLVEYVQHLVLLGSLWHGEVVW